MDVEGRRASQLRVTASVGTVGVPDRIYGSHAYCSVYEFREQEVHGSCLSSYRMHYLALTQVRLFTPLWRRCPFGCATQLDAKAAWDSTYFTK